MDPQIVLTRSVPDVVAGEAGSGTWHGVGEVWQALADWVTLRDDLALEAEELIDVGDRVLVLTRQTGRGKASGAPVTSELADLMTVRDGKILRWELYWDRDEARPAAGLGPA